jgi:hypothetical protein
MKKEIKSSSKRKWIVGGVVFFGALALLTTGFATWIIGVQNTSLNQDVGVSVSTTTNESVVLTANLSDSATIKLAESTEGFMKAYGDAVVTDPLQITFSDLNIVYGKEYKLSENFNHLHFAFDLEDTTTEGVKVASNGSKIATTYRAANSDGWTYIEAPDDVSIPILEPPVDSGNNSYIIDFSQKTFDFKWGTFFGGKSPATFYNEKFPGENTAAQDEEQNNVQAEMTAMYNALNAKTIKVIVSLTKTA